GECLDAPEPGTGDPETPIQTEADWQQARDMAERVAVSQGKMPGGLRRLLGEASRARADWRAITRRFITQACAADYSWTRPNRRYLSQGFILPTLPPPQCGRLALGFDTSGSVDAVTMRQMIGEVNAIAQEVQPAGIDMYYFHSEMWRHDAFEAGETVTLP